MTDLKAAEAILESHCNHGNGNGLVSALRDLQDEYHFLPREVLELTAERLDMPLSKVLRVATFYRCFSLEARGKHTICVCTGTACHVRGALALVQELERNLGVAVGRTTKDGAVTLDTVNCVGTCALGPVVVLDGDYHPEMSVGKVRSLLRRCAT